MLSFFFRFTGKFDNKSLRGRFNSLKVSSTFIFEIRADQILQANKNKEVFLQHVTRLPNSFLSGKDRGGLGGVFVA